MERVKLRKGLFRVQLIRRSQRLMLESKEIHSCTQKIRIESQETRHRSRLLRQEFQGFKLSRQAESLSEYLPDQEAMEQFLAGEVSYGTPQVVDESMTKLCAAMLTQALKDLTSSPYLLKAEVMDWVDGNGEVGVEFDLVCRCLHLNTSAVSERLHRQYFSRKELNGNAKDQTESITEVWSASASSPMVYRDFRESGGETKKPAFDHYQAPRETSRTRPRLHSSAVFSPGLHP